MATTLTTVRLTKGDSPSWGFRLQGGKDFGTPLVIQKVNGGSPAERAGLAPGDAVIRINHVDVHNLMHKEAQDVIVGAGPSFEMVIQRGGSVWKPSVIPTGTCPKPSPSVDNASPVTRTSLAARRGENVGAVGTGHNSSAKPFGPQVNGAINGGPKLVNKQYNSPVRLYSENAIAETLSAQTEILSTGALGVNFKKNEKDYDASNSAVYRMLKEAENDPATPSNDTEPDSGVVTAPNRGIAGLRRVEAPQNRPAPADPQLPPGQNICAECERLIVGVFVRIKDKNLHVECFKCSTCGTSLKNVGYYNINNKLYCDIHAKSAAIAVNNPSVVPVTVPPGGAAPATGAISAALSGHSLPSSSPLSTKLSSFAPSYQSSANLPGPKPFSSVGAPLSPGGTLSRGAPLSPLGTFSRGPLSPSAPSRTSYSPASSGGRTSTLNPSGALFKGVGAGRQAGGISVAPKRGRGVLSAGALAGARIPLCGHCHGQIRGPFITALGKIWCPQHFTCATPSCGRPLQDLGFVEERGQLYCEYCFERYLAPPCAKCGAKVKGDCLKAIGQNFHPECFSCSRCGKLFGNSPFFLEEGSPFCEADWNEMFTTKCFGCGFPVEAGDRWVEALNNNYHSQCFNCTMCKKNLEGQSFFAKGGRPFCKNHAR